MAKDKNSVLIYTDWGATFDKLKDDEAGRLIKHFFNYIRDQNPEPPDRLTEIIFEPIKQHLKRDLKKYELIRGKKSEAGKLSAEKRKQNSTSVKSVEHNTTNPTVPVNVSVNVPVSDNVIVIKKEDIDSRKLKFASTLKAFNEIYDRGLLKDFYDHWTEPNKSNTKFRQELEKVWDLKKRLNTWAKNDKNFKNNNNGNKPSRVESVRNSAERILRERGIDPNDFIKQPVGD